MSTVTDIDDLLAQLRKQLDRGGMTYKRAVDFECLIATFERIRAARIAEDERRQPANRPRVARG